MILHLASSWNPTKDRDSVTNEPSWEEIFASQNQANTPQKAEHLSMTKPVSSRREAREFAATSARAAAPARQRKQREPRRWGWLVFLFLFLGVIAGTIYYGWTNYEPQIRALLGMEATNDYKGSGEGDEVVVVIQSGDIGADVAKTLVKDEVIKSFEPFYALLLEDDVSFEPGNYSLKKHMSSASALEALRDPASRITQRVTIPEGTTLLSALELLSAGTEIPLEEFQSAAKKYTALGVPKAAPSLEGYLFPATYTFDPGASATQVLQQLVNETFARLDAEGVAKKDRHRVLTLAALIQREAGSKEEDFYKVSRVFTNRLAQDWKLESDATVTYGTGKYGTVWTTAEERNNSENKYNTYANKGLPIGPIGAPGDVAIKAALNPAKGKWLFFVTVNLQSGKTVFSETIEQHNAGVAQLQAWCAEPANSEYCD